MTSKLRFVVAPIVAIVVLYYGVACVSWATSWFLDPMWNAPVEEDPQVP